ncbi:MAG: AAA family ATPase [Dehalococcoidia bacterium]
MEIAAIIVGPIAGIFVIIFGGRGLVDLFRGYSERKRSRLDLAELGPDIDGPGVATAVAEPEAPPSPKPAVEAIVPPAPDPVYRRTFVGRDAELDTLHKAFDEALSGHGSLAMVVGEPGIGKTSLTEQLAGYAAEQGGMTLVGHCYEEGSLSLPYLPFVEAVRSHILATPADDLRAQLGHGADDLTRIVPELRDKVDVDLGEFRDPEEVRYRLLEAASDFLRSVSTTQPLLVVLEDLHDADKGTLDMLTHLARNLSGARLMVVGTYRDVEVNRSHPLSSSLAELRRVTSFERVALRGLTQDEVHRMLRAIAGHDVPWRWAEVVHRQTEGNPLFVQEVMRYLVEEGLLARDEGQLQRAGEEPLANRIPEGLRDVIGKRLTRLSDLCNKVLSIAAVVGRDFPLRVLQSVAGVPEDQLYDALKEATAVGVIEDRTDMGAGVSFRFTHAFFRQTLYEEIFAPERLQLHHQVGTALEEAYAGALEGHATEMAEHFAQSTDIADLNKAMVYSEMAARGSMEAYAYGDAARLLEQALKIYGVVAPDDKAKRCDLLIDLGSALMPAGNPQRVFEVLAPEAFALAEGLNDDAQSSRACQMAIVAMQRFGFASITTSPVFLEWAARADRYAPADSAHRVQTDHALALAGLGSGDIRASEAHLAHALETARRLDEPEALFTAASLAMILSTGPESEPRRLALAEEFVARDRAGVSARRLGQVLLNAGVAFVAWGMRDEAEAAWREMRGVADRARDPATLLSVVAAEAILLSLDGRLDDTLAAASRLNERGDEVGMPANARTVGATIVRGPLMQLGRYEEASTLYEAASHAAGGSRHLPSAVVMGALPFAYLGRLDEARDLLSEAMPRMKVGSPDESATTWEMVSVLQTAVLLGDHDLIVLLLPRLAGLALYLDSQSGNTAVARHLGAASALLGKPDQARGYYAQALEVCATARHRPETALTRLALAQLLLDSYPGEHAAAGEHLEFAIAELREMNMQPALEQALALQGK